MQLTEPQAGSDVGALRTRAAAAGGRHLSHRRPEDLHHLWRARPDRQHRALRAGAAARCARRHQGHLAVRRAEVPASTRTARSGARNDVRCHSIEHKLGIHGSPTCTMDLRRPGRRHRLPARRGKPRHELHVHDDEQCPPRGRPAGRRASPSARRRRRSPMRASAGRAARPARAMDRARSSPMRTSAAC